MHSKPPLSTSEIRVPYVRGYYSFDFPHINIPLSCHQFLPITEKSFCSVCKCSVTSKNGLICTKCGTIVHTTCRDKAYTSCEEIKSKDKGYTQSLEEYIAVSHSTSQPHLLVQSKTKSDVCQLCNLGIKSTCRKCLCCGAFFHDTCNPLRDCKKCYSSDTNSALQHHFIHGAKNVHLKCFVCKTPIQSNFGFTCVWCGMQVHTECLDKITYYCSCGRFGFLISRPTDLTDQYIFVCHFYTDEYYFLLRSVNPRQLVFDPHDFNIKITKKNVTRNVLFIHSGELRVLHTFLHLLDSNMKILTLQNDVGKALGWSMKLDKAFSYIQNSCESRVDIWELSPYNIEFLGYFGIGIDAYSLTAKTSKDHKIHLERYLDLLIDGVQVDLASYCGVLFMNINTFNGNNNECDETLLDDGEIEVFLFSSFKHFAMCLTDELKPIYYSQAKHVQLNVRRTICAEVDGSPFSLEQGVLHMQCSRQLTCLMYNKQYYK
ncbi:hypothetical protein EIN_130380 [Entamoeba invadens IP1]|uniref:Phorbol-ester/DAG-type domain-containing protein n=1 Tax=Entamoeba invadens IP1 TaxID=370355 RepID=A0A0A1UD77_ENTIV|nr:hypothetical protein EIN_130380 [Entamoeba invadens IP1]ELP94309.1 hypothetical protein EIN_130380 [Entamoeba invadens IP1]|eukprot:XP_004261080.1 hypothetical protein EIN_130380 [Entamoeba invadens IP1]